MSALAKEKLFLAMKKRGSMCSPNNHEFRQKEGHWRIKHCSPVETRSVLKRQKESNSLPRHVPLCDQGSQASSEGSLISPNKTDSKLPSHCSTDPPVESVSTSVYHSVSTVSHADEPSQCDESSRLTVRMENTYQLGPTKPFPVATVNRILEDVLTTYLQEAKYDPEFCRQMTKTISEVIKTQVKELAIPRYKLIVTVYIGQRDDQSILIGSRCLWNPKSDTVSSYTFKNSTLFALANVYAVYFE